MSTIFLCPHKLPCQVSCFALVSSSQRFFPLFQWLNKNRRKQRAVNRLMWDVYRYTQEYIGVALMCGWQKSLNLKLTELCLMPTWKMWATTSIYWDILRNELTLLTKQQTSNGNDWFWQWQYGRWSTSYNWAWEIFETSLEIFAHVLINSPSTFHFWA